MDGGGEEEEEEGLAESDVQRAELSTKLEHARRP